MSTGAFTVWTVDTSGALLNPPTPGNPPAIPDPGNPAATDIYFGINVAAGKTPSKDEVELQIEISKVLGVLQRLYRNGAAPAAGGLKFRMYYVRLFRLAQLGLEGPQGSEEIAKAALAMVAADIIDDEAGRIKNGHMKSLGYCAAAFCVLFLVLFVLLKLPALAPMQAWLAAFDMNAQTVANFMLLWVGCFVGVWLSYGVRTTTLSISDLVVTDSDRLIPAIRLIFAGVLTMLLGLTFVLGLVEIKLGSFSITDIGTRPMLAFLVGVFCGLSELVLPAAVAKRASDFIGKLK